MEGGSPLLIWERWDLPTYYAQQRYWGDHPPLQRIAELYFKIKPRKTPPRRAAPLSVDWSLLDKPLVAANDAKPIDVGRLFSDAWRREQRVREE